uniref:Uncharacterized protein n=1 Tax=Octopus bimaculoides TaxID=37653 RepID=A0A0L8I3B5_OCTBM
MIFGTFFINIKFEPLIIEVKNNNTKNRVICKVRTLNFASSQNKKRKKICFQTIFKSLLKMRIINLKSFLSLFHLFLWCTYRNV